MNAAPDREVRINRLSPRVPFLFAGFAFLLPALSQFWFIRRYAVNMIYADQWYDIRTIHRFHSGTLTIGNLWAQHGENRILFPNLIVLILAYAVHFNVVIEDCLSGLMLVLATILIIWAHKRRSPSTPWIHYFPAVVVLLSLNQGGMTLFGFAMSWYSVILGLAAALFILDRPNLNWIALTGAIAAAAVASFSDLEGLFIWPIGLLLMYHRRRSRRILGTWVAFAVATTALYFYNFNSTEASIDRTYVFTHPLLAARFFFFAFGNVAGVPIPAVPSARDYVFLVFGIVIFAIAVWVLVRGVPRRNESTARSIGVALVLFGVLYTVALTGARTGFGLPVLPRYAIYDLLVLAGCYLSLLDGSLLTARRNHPHSRRLRASRFALTGSRRDRSAGNVGSADPPSRVVCRGVLVAVICLMCVQAAIGTCGALQTGERWHVREVNVARITVNIHRASDALVETKLGSGYEAAGFIREMAGFARSQRLSLFATSDVSKYARRGLPVSMAPPRSKVVHPASGPN